MRKHITTLWLALAIGVALAVTALAHPGGHGQRRDAELRVWTNVVTGETVKASFLFAREGKIYVERTGGDAVVFPLNELAETDRQFAEAQIARIQRANQKLALPAAPLPTTPSRSFLWLALFGALAIAAIWWHKQIAFWRNRVLVLVCLLLLFICSQSLVRQQAQTSRPAAAAPFDAFAPKVRTRWDDKWLYVESNGIPDHPLMAGIKTWQQQVPVAQPYYGSNAWSIPLNPVPAAQPISAKTALFTGAIALAANGVPIFNALNNRGADAYAIEELDEWGGHCGRADDYHYHAAPLHIQKTVGTAQPIGYALDGFPLYGLNEPDGKPARPPDEFNGHADKADTYHYHSTKTYPYINGGMRGVVTVRDDEITPQAHAAPVRQYLQPLRGATITDFKGRGQNQWQVKYQLQGQTHEINYSLSDDGKADFTFVDGNGNATTEHYSRRNGERRPGPQPPNDDRRPPRRPPDDANGPPPPPPDDDRQKPRRNPDDPNQPRPPWIVVHAQELDANHDGVITMQELTAEVNATFIAFDRNADGKLSADEYNDACGIRRVLAGFVTQPAKEIDADNDGVITKDELMAACQRMFRRADRNNDGKLTADELAAER